MDLSVWISDFNFKNEHISYSIHVPFSDSRLKFLRLIRDVVLNSTYVGRQCGTLPVQNVVKGYLRSVEDYYFNVHLKQSHRFGVHNNLLYLAFHCENIVKRKCFCPIGNYLFIFIILIFIHYQRCLEYKRL